MKGRKTVEKQERKQGRRQWRSRKGSREEDNGETVEEVERKTVERSRRVGGGQGYDRLTDRQQH